jgi:hypothetical protein
LSSRTVTWIDRPEDVRETDATPMTIADRHAIITIAAPVMDDDRAEVATELWCRFLGAVGSTFVLERSREGVWKVTEDRFGYVS